MIGEKIPLRQLFTDSEIAQALHEMLIDAGILHTCTNCMWGERIRKPLPGENGTCSYYRVVPPAVIIVKGCPAWEADIPF